MFVFKNAGSRLAGVFGDVALDLVAAEVVKLGQSAEGWKTSGFLVESALPTTLAVVHIVGW